MSHKGLVLLSEKILGGLKPLAELRRCEGLDRESVRAEQQARLSRLLLHAADHVPYYRDILRDVGVVRGKDEVCLDSFDKIPCLDKGLLRSEFDALKSDDLPTRRWYVNTSGGSTGEPTKFIQEKQCKDWIRAIRMLFDEWSGCPIGARKAFLWGSERDLFVGHETATVRLKRWIKNELWLNAFRMTRDAMRGYVEEVNAFRPVQIQAYASSMYEFARFIDEEGLTVFSPRSVLTSAGTLYPHMRELIERVFRAPVFNRYGTREVGDVACQREHTGGLHVVDIAYYVEILRPDGSPAVPGEVGEIFITYLINYAMPLIRYGIGDMGAWSEDGNIATPYWSTLERVTGRVTDSFVRRDGGIVTAEYLIHLVGVVLNKGWIRRYQVVQEDYEDVRVLVALAEPDPRPSETHGDSLAEIAEKIRLVMGESCKVEFDFVEDIAPTPSGKYRYTISKVRNN